MTTLNRLHMDAKADLVAIYEERLAAKDFKNAVAIKMKLAQLDTIYLGNQGKADQEPEPLPESFATQRAVVAYLVEGGWKANDSTLSLHVQQRKLVAGPTGAFSLADVESYALANLVNNPQRSEKTTSDELTLEAKRLENRRLRMKVEQQEGTLINSEDVKRELENMLVTFRSQLLLLPRVLASQLSQMSDPHQIETLLNGKMRDILTNLSQYQVEAAS